MAYKNLMHAICTAGIVAGGSAFSVKDQSPPNVLFVICDDLNDSVEGMGGHPQAKTPNLDRFMQSAVRFDNAHCNVSICGPSRASLLSGLYPHTTGYYGWAQNARGGGDPKNPKSTFDPPVLKESTTFVQNFAQNGYTVFGTIEAVRCLYLARVAEQKGHRDDAGRWQRMVAQ